jgi:intracellular septation protein A
MEKLGLILAFYTFFGCLWWVVATITSKSIWGKIIFKLFGITGCVLSFIYILKFFNFI